MMRKPLIIDRSNDKLPLVPGLKRNIFSDPKTERLFYCRSTLINKLSDDGDLELWKIKTLNQLENMLIKKGE